MKNVFDKRQLGYKVTANSLYGQCGAKTSSFFEMDIAASTTATGRKLLIYAKEIIEGLYGDRICETKYGKVRSKGKVVYGDTDSIFIKFSRKATKDNELTKLEAVDHCIQCGLKAGAYITSMLKRVDVAAYNTFMDASKGQFTSGVQVLGLAEGGVDWALDENNMRTFKHLEEFPIIAKRDKKKNIFKRFYDRQLRTFRRYK